MQARALSQLRARQVDAEQNFTQVCAALTVFPFLLRAPATKAACRLLQWRKTHSQVPSEQGQDGKPAGKSWRGVPRPILLSSQQLFPKPLAR